jgi:hypothetical protein
MTVKPLPGSSYQVVRALISFADVPDRVREICRLVQLSTKYELIINLRTAKAVGITVPPETKDVRHHCKYC